MSAVAQAAQVEVQTAEVEQEYHREDKREHKVMDAKILAPKFHANLLAVGQLSCFSSKNTPSDTHKFGTEGVIRIDYRKVVSHPRPSYHCI